MKQIFFILALFAASPAFAASTSVSSKTCESLFAKFKPNLTTVDPVQPKRDLLMGAVKTSALLRGLAARLNYYNVEEAKLVTPAEGAVRAAQARMHMQDVIDQHALFLIDLDVLIDQLSPPKLIAAMDMSAQEMVMAQLVKLSIHGDATIRDHVRERIQDHQRHLVPMLFDPRYHRVQVLYQKVLKALPSAE